ncbi:MAG: hypothetical protein RLZZ15_2764 [Verrucomicrobiota bacterium]
MIRVFPLLRFGAALVVALLLLPLAAADRTFTTTPTLREEAQTFIKILEQVHYNRDAVKSSDFVQVIPDYMAELDPHHLYFLGSDKTAFTDKYGKSVYYNTAFLGNIDAAYAIFNTYQTRVEARVAWIFEQLKTDVDLTAKETYRADRTKS